MSAPAGYLSDEMIWTDKYMQDARHTCGKALSSTRTQIKWKIPSFTQLLLLSHQNHTFARNGYATRLLSLLHHQLSNLPPPPYSFGSLPEVSATTIPKAIGSMLWSDVGSTFYSKCTSSSDRPGWVVEKPLVTELIWKILPPQSTKLDDGWEWLYLDDLPSIGAKLSNAAKLDLSKRDTSQKTLFQHDPASEGTLSFIPTKGMWQRPLIEDPEPVGLRFIPSDSQEQETIIIFSMRMINIGDRLLITYIHNLSPPQLPTVLKAMDILGHKAGQTEGWIWGLSASRPNLVKTWQGLEDRQVKTGQRQEIDGHLLGVAWYGPLEENGELIDGQMWTWA
uniref:Uncharacterized protein n=1 Tax=Kwoniella pini CBS 10737 TaxID=1296096 RepID=A0A1B9I3I1_9TREE|nr:uncharacterized protein I206_03411 [Kwoniella pini CBS 10737]OCF50094.1 hypothetical protein I206_03411 [Kwoniella pini CBS 10737]